MSIAGDWAFCRNCGRAIGDESTEAAAAEAAPQPRPLSRSAAQVPTSADVPPTKKPPRWHHGSIWVFALLAGAAVIAIASIIYAASGPSSGQAPQTGGISALSPAPTGTAQAEAARGAVAAGTVVDVVTLQEGVPNLSTHALSRDKIVWVWHDNVGDASALMCTDLAGGKTRSLAKGHFFSQASVSGNKAVWLEGSGSSRAKIRGVRVTGGPAFVVAKKGVDSGSSPDASGPNIVWNGFVPTPGSGLFHFDPEAILSTSLQSKRSSSLVTRSHDWLRSPAISRQTVVFELWQGMSPSMANIYGHDLRTGETFVVCDAKRSQFNPAIDGSIVAWEDKRTGDWDIRAKDLATGETFVVCDEPNYQYNPAVSRDIVVWEDWRNKPDVEIWGKNLSTGQAFLVAETAQTKKGNPVAISGDIVAWPDGSSIRAVRLKPEWLGTSDTKAAETPRAAPDDSTVIQWTDALGHVGETVTVEGPVIAPFYADTENGEPTFLNVGRDYPDPNRFVVVIWGEDRSSFPQAPESMYEGKTIRVTGLVSEYDGCAQIEVASPSAIQVVK